MKTQARSGREWMGGELMNEVEGYVCVSECERELCERAAAL